MQPPRMEGEAEERGAAADPVTALFAAVVASAMDDLGCRGRIGGCPERRRETGLAPFVRFLRAAKFIESDLFVIYCRAGGLDPELWRRCAGRHLQLAAAARLRPALEPVR